MTEIIDHIQETEQEINIDTSSDALNTQCEDSITDLSSDAWYTQCEDSITDLSSNAWYTPSWLIEKIREVLGSIDTDPASCDIAQTIVKANKYYTKENSGLDKDWEWNVFMNPPYSRELYPVFVNHFLDQWHNSNITNGIVLTRNNTDTEATQRLLHQCDNALFLNKRIVFWNPEKPTGKQTDKCGHIVFLFSQDLTAQFLFKKVFANQGFFLR